MNSSIISVRRALAGAAAVLVVGLAAAAPSAHDGGSSPGNLRAGIPFVGTVIAGDFNYKEIRPSPAPAPALSSPHPLS